MFTRSEKPNLSSKKFLWGLLSAFVLLIAGIEVAVNSLITLPALPTLHAKPTAPATSAWLCQHASETANPVQAENFCPGTTSWRADRPTSPEHAVEGFTSPISAQSGDTVKLYVSTIAPTYSFEVYRMGWYGGL